jgi:hypothetical protein
MTSTSFPLSQYLKSVGLGNHRDPNEDMAAKNADTPKRGAKILHL